MHRGIKWPRPKYGENKLWILKFRRIYGKYKGRIKYPRPDYAPWCILAYAAL